NGGLKLAAGDKVLWTLPMAHHFAVTIVLYLYHGVTTVLETSHRPDRLYEAARESGTHLLYGSPFHFAQLAQCKEAGPLPELRMAISTASALIGEVAKAFQERFHLPLTQALGIIEVGLPILNAERAGDLPEALGKPLAGYEAKVAGDGELLLKGPGMFDAYLIPWQRREEILQEGWFGTGDLAELLEDGTVVMRGRKKSVINVGGMKVFPEEIEAVLNAHPAVARSRVFPERHPSLGSFPCAEVILEEGAEMPKVREMRQHCMEKLASYKIPLQFSVVDSIALTASGKVKRH
ncbi:MAG: fatty acid--CoA ligase family protein, partial [Luteolibacter sp.]